MRTTLARSSPAALLLTLTLLLAALAAVGTSATASAQEPIPQPSPPPGAVLLTPTPGIGENAARRSPKMLEAIQRDMRLTRAGAITRLGRQHAADAVEARARRAAGRHFAGSWLTPDGSALMVALTDQRAAPAVRAAGANPTQVTHRRGELEAARQKLRARADKLPGTAVHGWHVDPERNRLVVTAASGSERAAAQWVTAAGVPPGLVAYDKSQGPSMLTADLLGGDRFINRFRNPAGLCTVGFGAERLPGARGFITAGHCTNRGDLLDLGTGVGTTVSSTFPTTRAPDQAYVEVDAGTQPLPSIRSNAGTIPVQGSQAALRGTLLCSFGDISKYRCGNLTTIGRDAPSFFSDRPNVQVTILGVNDAAFCSSGGDSGGPVINPMNGQAQGVISSTTCNSPPRFTSAYQPINKAMLDLRVKLLLAGSPPAPPPPVITAFFCYADELYGYPFNCDLYWEGGTDPDEVQVSSNGSQAGRYNDYDQNYVSVSGRCDPYQDTYVSVSVFDADGRRVDATQNGFCPRN
ncbi:S1 family peptidase [Spirillospora sp. NPDC047279]|uniref:S1 family peptidase n=1 Tax=Spirillospora sp. NPDC047279 TaxID=3155478 RepID=UPI0033C20818